MNPKIKIVDDPHAAVLFADNLNCSLDGNGLIQLTFTTLKQDPGTTPPTVYALVTHRLVMPVSSMIRAADYLLPVLQKYRDHPAAIPADMRSKMN